MATHSSAPRCLHARRLYALSNAPLIDTPVKLGDSVVVFTGRGKSFRIDEDAPSIHGSHLLGYEGSMSAYFYYRAATESEIEVLATATADRAARAKRQNEIARIRKHITATGERPFDVQPEGRRVLDAQDIYGGGDWFVIGDAYIWYILNHGADGDDWSQNNVRTGGAGAIGWRIPYDLAIATELLKEEECRREPQAIS
jgi:hypothetical protein